MKTHFVTALLFVSAIPCAGDSAQGPFLHAGDKKVPAPDAKEKSADEKTIRALIADLSDDAFEKREKAHEKLLRIGGPAIELLRKASKESADLEARERASHLAVAIQELSLHSFRVDFHHDFRNRANLDKKFELFGPVSPQVVKPEPQGLRITLPAEGKNKPNGVSADFLVKGDIEITVAYEHDKPAQPGRSAFELYIMSDTMTMEAISFSRILSDDGRGVYTCGRMTTIEGGRRNLYGGEGAPAKGKAGQMRMVRVGSKVALSVKEVSDADFRVVHRVEFGEEAIKLVRFAAQPFGTGTAVDVRVVEARFRGADADAFRPLSEAKTLKNRVYPRD